MHKDRLELFREGHLQIIMNTLSAYGFEAKNANDAHSNLSECIGKIVAFIQRIAPDTRSYLERHFGDEQQIEYEFPLDPERPGTPSKGRKFTMGSMDDGSKYWHLYPEKRMGFRPNKLELHGVDTADLLITRVVHCLWRRKTWETKEPLPTTNPLGSFEENKEFYAQEIYHAVIEHIDRYLGNEDFNEVSALEAQHITLLKRRLEAEAHLRKMGFTTSNPKARIKHLQSTLCLTNPQLIQILKVVHSDLIFHNANVEKNYDCTGHVDHELECSVGKLILEVEHWHNESSIKTHEARKSSNLVLPQQAAERLEVLAAMCNHLLNTDERLASVFKDAKKKKTRDQIIKICFYYRGETPPQIGHTICDSKSGLQFKWITDKGVVRKFIKHPDEDLWVKSPISPSPDTPSLSNSYTGSFSKLLKNIDEIRGLKSARPGRPRRKKVKRPLGYLDPTVEEIFKSLYNVPINND